jgi:hypothetical protein
MEKEWGDDVLKTDSARFASYAALRRGIISERGYAEWCRWVADRVGEKAFSGGRRARAVLRRSPDRKAVCVGDGSRTVPYV